MNYNKIEDEDESLSNYYDIEEDSDDNKAKNTVKYYKNQPYDIAFNINESLELNSTDNLKKEKSPEKSKINTEKFEKLKTENKDDEEEEEKEEEEESEDEENKQENDYKAQDNKTKLINNTTQTNTKPLPRFDIKDFSNINASSEIKDLLQIMNKFNSQEINLETKLRPFIPSYLPNIGEVDAFIKVNRPDGLQEELGLNVVDEPITNGIDPYIFKLMLIDETKHKVDRYEVRSIPNSEKNPKAIQTWIDKVTEMRKNKVSSSVTYSKNFPDIENLMQVWPEKMESGFKEISFPNEKLNLSVENYSKLICNLIDIPVHNGSNKSMIESLHVLFTLYSEFKQNQHFQRNTVNDKEGNVQSKMFY